jgi:hypothetical protein
MPEASSVNQVAPYYDCREPVSRSRRLEIGSINSGSWSTDYQIVIDDCNVETP